MVTRRGGSGCIAVWSLLAIALACAPRGEGGSSALEVSRRDEATATPAAGGQQVGYPVDPQVHLEESGDPMDPASYTAKIDNDLAHARYALALTSWQPQDELRDEADLLRQAVAIAKRQKLAPSTVMEMFFVRADAAAQERRKSELAALSGGDHRSDLSRGQLYALDIETAVQQCREQYHGSAKDCCRALLFPWAVLPPPASARDEDRTMIRTALADSDFYAALAQQLMATRRPRDIFRPLGLKSWLAACNVAVTKAPASLEELKQTWSFHRADTGWQSELHPTSRAKLAGRRIYRHPDFEVSIAESLNADCSVMETELVVPGPGRARVFWTYDGKGRVNQHGLFPDYRGGHVIKATPDSCMGCHYTFDQRHFSVRVPSYQALHLGLGGAGAWRDDGHCAKPGEPVVRHL